MTGTLDDGPDALPPQGEFFTSQRNEWMRAIPGQSLRFASVSSSWIAVDYRYFPKETGDAVGFVGSTVRSCQWLPCPCEGRAESYRSKG